MLTNASIGVAKCPFSFPPPILATLDNAAPVFSSKLVKFPTWPRYVVGPRGIIFVAFLAMMAVVWLVAFWKSNSSGGMARRPVMFVTLRKIGSSRVKFITMSRSLALRCFRLYKNPAHWSWGVGAIVH